MESLRAPDFLRAGKHKQNLRDKMLKTKANVINRFVEILLYTNIYPLYRYKISWNPNCRLPLVNEVLKRGVNQFEEIKIFFDFNESSTMKDSDVPSPDKLLTIPPIVKTAKQTSKNLNPDMYNQ